MLLQTTDTHANTPVLVRGRYAGLRHWAAAFSNVFWQLPIIGRALLAMVFRESLHNPRVAALARIVIGHKASF